MSSGSETRKATQRVTVRFTPEGFAQVTAAAERAGFDSVGEFLRVRAMGPGQGRGAKRPQGDRAALVRTLAEMGKIGSNVNQLAHAANAGGDIPAAVVLHFIKADLSAAFEAVRKALGRR